MGSAYLRALADRRPRRLSPGASTPVIEAEVASVQAAPDRLAAYREVCELPDDGSMPLTYPHVLATGLQMAMLLHPQFPVRMVGLVHLSNDIELLAPLPADARLALDCRLDGGRKTRRGDEFRLVTEVLHDGELAWRETMNFLAPAEHKQRSPPPEPPELPPSVGEWQVPADIGRNYARVSGDWNPIHLADFLARPFGFPAAIAHGMWAIARCLACLPGPVQPGARFEVRFLRPLLLPGNVRLHLGPEDARGRKPFWLVSAANAIPHLKGRWHS